MAKGTLSGVKVLEYCGFVAGPYCTKQFSDLGAEVIKIEAPAGDEARRRGPFLGDNPDPELSGVFLYNNTNKKGVTLNLETPQGREIFKKLVVDADVFVEDRPPGEMKRLGLGYEELEKLNPGLIMASITPFGQDGPYRDYKAYYLNTYHASGSGYVLPASSPNADREPLKGGGYIGESDVGVCAAVGILGALYWRYCGGSGQYIDISRQEAEMALERIEIMRYYETGKSPSRVKTTRLRDVSVLCRDGGYLKFVLHPEKQWTGVCNALGNPEWTKQEKFSTGSNREANFRELEGYLSGEAKKYDTEELFFMVQAEGTACAPICSAEQVYKSPQTKARNFYVEMDHPAAGKLKYPGLPYKLSTAGVTDNFGAPLLGQHNEEIYCDRLGYGKAELVKLREAGII